MPPGPTEEVGLAESTLDFVRWLFDTTTLEISGLHGRRDRADREYVSKLVSTALGSLPSLMTLCLRGTEISLPSILDGMGDIGKYHTNLSVLDMQNVGSNGSSSRWHTLIELEGTAPFTNLRLDQFSQTAEALEALVRWPKCLETLWFLPVGSYHAVEMPLFQEWTFTLVQPILETQIASLRELTIMELTRHDDRTVGDIENLDLTAFAKLEVLTLPSFFTGYDKRHIPRIVAPSLRVLNWLIPFYNSTGKWGHREETVEDFGQEQEDWVRAMVDFVAKEQRNLREIYVDFQPHEFRSMDRVEGFVYPWDRLDEMARDSEKFGIQLRYEEPSVSREDFENWEMSVFYAV